jgi:hypothetical protein
MKEVTKSIVYHFLGTIHNHMFIKFNIYAIIKMSFINSLSSSGAGTVGPRGYTGADGAKGVHGVDGADGVHGVDGADGVHGVDGADGNNGVDGADGNNGANGNNGAAGPRGYTGSKGADGNNAGPNPTFDNVTVNNAFSCGSSIRMRGYRTLRTNGIQLNWNNCNIDGIGRKFTGIVVLSALGNDHSSGVFAVSNNSNSVGGHINDLSIQGDYSDANKRVGLRYINGTLMAIKYNTRTYQRYTVSFFGFHP